MSNADATETDELRCRLVAVEAARDAECRMFHAMAETLGDIVFTATPTGAWDFVNARLREVTGMAPEAAMGAGWLQAVHPDDAERIMDESRRALESGTPSETNIRLRTPDGAYRRFVAHLQPVRAESGVIVRWVGAATDVDDHLDAEDARQQAMLCSRAATSKLVHDLRNGVAPIAYAVAILKMASASADQRQEAIATIEAQVRELRNFLDRIASANADVRKALCQAKNAPEVGAPATVG